MNKNILENRDLTLKKDGIQDTYLNDVKIFKTTKYEPKSPLIYDVSLILVLQGKKIANLVETSITFDCDNYLVVPTTLPLECETYASKEEPFICLLICIDRQIMYEIIELIEKKEFTNNNDSIGIFSDKVTQDIENITIRLLNILESKEQSLILGNSILKELFYHIAIGKNANFLHKLFLGDNHEAKIARSLKVIHDDYNKDLDIPTLARMEEMSISSYYTHFKRITFHTPLQYIKKIKLNKAKDLLIKHNYQVIDTAYELGYDSPPSQFSRDFKNYFGHAPSTYKS